MSRTYKTEGVVLKRRNFGEADKLITIFSKHYGKITSIAKGIRKLTSRKGGNLEVFNQVVVFLAKGKSLDIITEVQLLYSYPGLRKDLKKVSIAFNICKLVDLLIKEGQTNIEVYDLLVQSLKKIETSKDLAVDIRDFKIAMLNSTGFGLPAKKDNVSLDDHIAKIIEKKVKFLYV